ncbi:MAG: ABC transporter permease subunit [Pseudomonadota bacterium]|nr:ABC transporter permease subunit [Pseudomonadota bacterium]
MTKEQSWGAGMDLSLFAIGPTGWGDELIAGFGLTLRLGLSGVIFGTALGLVAALTELSASRWLGRAMEAWNVILRSVPELLVIFLVYYGASFGLQALLRPFGIDRFIDVSAFWAAVIALSVIHAAYASEVFKGAFIAVPAEQIEAARAFGMSRGLAFARIKLPIALRLAFAGLVNMVLVTLKSTPLVSAIGLQDLIRAAGEAGQNTKYYFQFFMASLVVYLIIAAGALALQLVSERRLYRHLRRERAA